MIKEIIILIGIFTFYTNTAWAGQKAMECFQLGFAKAAKAYESGDGSMFDPGYASISAKAVQQSPCCTKGLTNPEMDKGCLGYAMAFTHIYRNGTNKNTYSYYETMKTIKMLDLGTFGY